MTALSSRRLARTATVATAALTAVLLAGCTTDEPETPATPEASPTVEAEPTPEPSPTLDEAAQLKQDNIDAAKQRIVDYWTASAEVGANSYQNWEDLEEYFMPELWKIRKSLIEDTIADGTSSKGAVEVVSMTVTDYRPSDNGTERVILDACMDSGGITPIDKDGNPVERSDSFEPRRVVEYVVAHNGTNSLWRIEELNGRDETC